MSENLRSVRFCKNKMRKTLILGLLIWVCQLLVWAQRNDAALNQVVAAEKAFAAMAATNGTKPAFLEFAANDGVVFNTKPENAQEYWTKHAETTGLLAWAPAWADVSADGSLGFTTGGWEFRPKGKSDAPVAWGEYFTIWKKQPGGKWTFELDIGVDHAFAPLIADWRSPAPLPAPKKNSEQSAMSWQDAELKFSETLRTERANGVYQKLAAENVRLLRGGKLPITGKKAALEQFPKESLTLKTKALGGAATTDFIYTYGEYDQAQNGKNEKGFFVRVWKREPKGWRITVDVAYALPAETR